jgi:oxaloacetate decarboxylase alpha subunit
VEAGVDNVDTAISSMSMTYGHSPTESLVAMLDATGRSTGLDIELLEEIASYFREVRKKYAKFEGSLRGIDSRILVAQVPGGMLTNLENQLREQNASDKLDDVLAEIPKVREELGFIALVTPTSQIVGSQSVLNILSGERYQTITKETAGVLKGEYGSTPAPVNADLQAKVLDGAEAITCRPADLLESEFEKQKGELLRISKAEGIRIANEEDDTLTYALFPQAGLKFLKNRDNPDAFEPVPVLEAAVATPVAAANVEKDIYTVEVAGQAYVVRVSSGGDVTQLAASGAAATPAPPSTPTPATAPVSGGTAIPAPLAGNVIKLMVNVGDTVAAGDVILILEAMKMETEIRSQASGQVAAVNVSVGDAVKVGDSLMALA